MRCHEAEHPRKLWGRGAGPRSHGRHEKERGWRKDGMSVSKPLGSSESVASVYGGSHIPRLKKAGAKEDQRPQHAPHSGRKTEGQRHTQ